MNQAETFAWEYWKAMGEMKRWDAAVLYVQTVEVSNPNWWSLLIAGDLERGKQGVAQYVVNRRRDVFGDHVFEEEDGWEREDGRSSGDDTDVDGDFVLMKGRGSSTVGSNIAVEDLSHVPVGQRVQLLQRELARRQAVNRRLMDENDGERMIEEAAAARAEEEAKVGVGVGELKDGKGAESNARSESFAERLQKMLVAQTDAIQVSIQKRLDELDASLGLGPNAPNEEEEREEEGDEEAGSTAALEAELVRREEEKRAKAEAEAAKLSSDIAEAIASPLPSPLPSPKAGTTLPSPLSSPGIPNFPEVPKAEVEREIDVAIVTETPNIDVVGVAAEAEGKESEIEGEKSEVPLSPAQRAALEAAEAVSSIASGVLTAMSPPRSPRSSVSAPSEELKPET